MDFKEKFKLWSEMSDFEKYLIIQVYIESVEKDEKLLIEYYKDLNEKAKILAMNPIKIDKFLIKFDRLLVEFLKQDYEQRIIADKISIENYNRFTFYGLGLVKGYSEDSFLARVFFPSLSKISKVKIEYKWTFSADFFKLRIKAKAIESLKSLLLFENLKELDIAVIQVKNITDFAFSPSLEIIKLNGTNQELQNLNFFSELKNIREFNLHNICIKSLDGIGRIENLKELELQGDFSNMDVLSDAKNLEILFLNSKFISNISFLSNFQMLKKLSLNSPLINNFNNINNCHQLTDLYLNGVGIDDISFIKGLNNIKVLHLNDNFIKNIEIINSLVYLEELSLNNNEIEICNLSNLNKIRHLFLDDNSITTINSICFNEIISLYISNNPIKNLLGIENAKRLLYLNINHLNLPDFDPLMNWANESYMELNYIGTIIGKIESEKDFILTHDRVGIQNSSWRFPVRSLLRISPSYKEMVKKYFEELDKREI